ncbi:MAG: DUF2877 domain-containing protein, partial [Clostridia bacterium]|nr:DUF2877 domain-containing protein [Clostridia bacterium]
PSAEPVISWLIDNAGEDGLSPLATGRGDNPWTALVRPRLPELFRTVAAGDAERAAAAAARIAGCGPGLTPSSDDLLCGYMAALHALTAAEPGGDGEAARLRLTRRMAESAAGKTNRISGTFLLESGDGYASDDVLRLLEALFSGAGTAALEAAAARVGGFGSTSGADMLTGMALAIIQHSYRR